MTSCMKSSVLAYTRSLAEDNKTSMRNKREDREREGRGSEEREREEREREQEKEWKRTLIVQRCILKVDNHKTFSSYRRCKTP